MPDGSFYEGYDREAYEGGRERDTSNDPRILAPGETVNAGIGVSVSGTFQGGPNQVLYPYVEELYYGDQQQSQEEIDAVNREQEAAAAQRAQEDVLALAGGVEDVGIRHRLQEYAQGASLEDLINLQANLQTALERAAAQRELQDKLFASKRESLFEKFGKFISSKVTFGRGSVAGGISDALSRWGGGDDSWPIRPRTKNFNWLDSEEWTPDISDREGFRFTRDKRLDPSQVSDRRGISASEFEKYFGNTELGARQAQQLYTFGRQRDAADLTTAQTDQEIRQRLIDAAYNFSPSERKALLEAVKNADSTRLRDLQYRVSTRLWRNEPSPEPERKQNLLGRVVSPVFNVLEDISEPLQRAYYAGKRVQLQGGNVFQQARAIGAGLPGLGFAAGRGTLEREAIEATNTRAEREQLTRDQQLASFGEFVTGRARPDGRGGVVRDETPNLLQRVGSTVLDLGFSLATDPLNAVGLGLSPLRQVGRTAGEAGLRAASRAGYDVSDDLVRTGVQQVGRGAFIRGERGQAIIDAAVQAARENRDLRSLTNAVRGLAPPAAQEVLTAARTGGETAVREAFERAFASGAWNPSIALPRLATGVGIGRNVAPRGLGVLSATRRVVRGDGTGYATGITHAANQALDRALQRGAEVSGQFTPDLRNLVRDEVEAAGGVRERLDRIVDLSRNSQSAGFADAVAEEVGEIRRLSGIRENPNLPFTIVNQPTQEAFQEAERRLSRLEIVQAMLDGRAGDRAAQQVRAELGRGFQSSTATGVELLERAAKNIGQVLPATEKIVRDKTTLKGLRKALDDPSLPADIAKLLNDDLKTKKGIGRVSRAVDLMADPSVRDEVVRLLDNAPERTTQAAIPTGRQAGIGGRVVRRAGQLLLDTTESIQPSSVPFQRGASEGQQILRRTEAIDRWATAVGLDDLARSSIRQSVGAAQTEQQVYNAIEDALRQIADRAGVASDDLVAVYRANRAAFRQNASVRRAFGVDDAGRPIRDQLSTVTQRIEDIPLPNVNDVKRSIRLLREEGPGDLAAKLAMREANRSQSAQAVGKFLRGAHHAWKFNIVTNAYAPVLGATAGLTMEDGSLAERLRAAALGAGIGMLGPLRYVGRVALIEERILRYYMARGFRPAEWVPGLAKWSRRRGVDLPFREYDLVRAGRVAEIRIGSPFATSDSAWVAVGKRESRYVDSLSRVVNYQIHPESDELARIFLNVRAGEMTAEQGINAAKQFLRTEDGKLLRDRLADGLGGTRKVDEIISRYQDFITKHTDPELARMRLDNAGQDTPIPRDVVKQAAKSDWAPDFVHGQKTWVRPKNFGEARATRNKILADLVFEGPTNKFSREPLAESIYRDEYLRLRNAGVPAETARETAEHLAVTRTNQVMFKVEDESRFAKKVDIVAPFQQPKEELIRVWGKVLKDNPVRTLKVAHQVARAFNNGVDNGTFYQDQYGDWRLTLPGGFVSNHVYGLNTLFEARLKDFLFFSQGAFGADLGVGLPLPTPGGPIYTVLGKIWAKAYPDAYLNMPETLKEMLFPFGNTGSVLSGPERRLWMGINGAPMPWDFAAREDQEDQLRKWQVEIHRQLVYQHVQKTGDTDWQPSPEEVRDATKAFLQFWAFAGSVSPAAPQPLLTGRKDYQEALDTMFKDKKSGEINWTALRAQRPDLEIYIGSGSQWVGPDDFKHWEKQDEDFSDQYVVGHREHLSLEQFTKNFEEARRTSEGYRAFGNALQTPGNGFAREAALREWREKYPDIANSFLTDYAKEAELARILQEPVVTRDQLLDNWRQQYNVSHREYERLRNKIELVGFERNIWNEARYTEDVVKDVRSNSRGNEEAYVATLHPAEQVRYWKDKQAQLNYHTSERKNPQAVLDDYNRYQALVSSVYAQHPELAEGGSLPTVWDEWLSDWKGDQSSQINAAYTEINRISPAINQAYDAKDWNTFNALRAKRQSLFDLIKKIRNDTYEQIPDLGGILDKAFPGALVGDAVKASLQDLAAQWVDWRVDNGNWQDFQTLHDAGFPWIPSNEEQHYLSMPEGVKQAYISDLVAQLNIEPGNPGKLYWEYLTDFQMDILERNVPEDQLRVWRGTTYASSSGSGSTFSGGSGGSSYRPRGSSTPSELQYAYDLFAQYSQRPSGAVAPAAYEEYLALPRNPAVRSQFLKEHPEVADWIRLGPMANMPELQRLIVTNIMVKYGKWEGETQSLAEVTDLAFAREQLQRWNRRTGPAPATYDFWLNMPSGPEKQIYLREHPEIGDWIRLGPMANMPEHYQDVVRDIMFRYGEWTQSQDPLGQTIAEYYRLPEYARKQFLKEHPELTDYWALSRTPEEQRMFDMADQYFSLQDAGAKRAYMASNPELQQWFVTQRTKRYEKFLNQVAQFMGSNPEMFTHYLERQSDVLSELLNRYATPALMREAPTIRAQAPRRERNRTGS